MKIPPEHCSQEIVLERMPLTKRLTGFSEIIMYAVIKTGGKQYRIAEGTTLKVEKLDIAAGENVEITDVLLIANGEELKVGAPVIEGAKVTAEVVAHGRGPKIKIIKFKRRKHHRKQMGHRQWFTELKISSIAG